MTGARWLAFILADNLTSSLLHFFPAAVGAAVPYKADCQLSVFGAGRAKESVVLDGARLGQPDGIRLEQAFPFLKEGGSGLFGLEVLIDSHQPRTDLSSSLCVVDLEQQAGSVRFWARSLPLKPEEADSAPGGGILVKDSYATTSLVCVNSSSQSLELTLPIVGAEPLALGIVQAGHVVERAVPEQAFSAARVQERSWGLARALGCAAPKLSTDQSAYLLYRNAKNQLPLSVVAL